MTPIRYAILTSVSTPEQAGKGRRVKKEDKISLTFQEQACRAAGLSNGWSLTAEPFVIDGYSRSSYVNLSDAERDIPPLHAALEALRANRFDVLAIFSYDRFGDLTPMLSNEFRNYRKQIYSVSQPSVVQDPELYNPYLNESADIQQDAARMVQRFRINDLRRKWIAGMPARIFRGLTPLRVPFGYRWVGKKEPPVLVEREAALILQMKDWLFAGLSMNQITERCSASSIAPANGGQRWDPSAVRYILANSYYAGQLVLHRTRSMHDPTRKHKTRAITQPPSKWETGRGLHQPLWDEDTHRAILRELDLRRERNLRSALRFPLSGLLTCSVCGQKLHRRSNSSGRGRRKVLTCRNAPAHVILAYDDGVRIVGNALLEALKEEALHPRETHDDSIPHLRLALDEMAALRKRIQSGYESGIYTSLEASQRLAEIDTSTEAYLRQIEQARRESETAGEFRTILSGQDLDRLPEWIVSEEPAVVNRTLAALCKKIDLTPEGQVHITFR